MVAATWSDDRVERLKTLWASGLSCSQIAAELGNVTRNAVIGKVHRLGLPGRADDRRAKAIEAKRAPRLGSPTPRRTKVLRAVLTAPDLGTQAEEPADDPAAGHSTAFDASIPTERRKGLLDLRDGDCKWPIGDPTTPDFFFCGDPAVSEQPYCGRHCREAYQHPSRELRISPEERARRIALGQRLAAMHRAKRAVAS